MTKSKQLQGQVALVTGSSRGAGRGIALVLGEAGATVYVTGRSTRAQSSQTDLTGTIEDTADEVTARGGVGIAVRCDHTIEADVQKLYEQIKQEQGTLDLVVNNAWGGYEDIEKDDFLAPFWKQPLRRWDSMFDAGLRAQMVSSRYAMSTFFLEQKRGLIINTGVYSDIGGDYPVNVFYDTVKRAVVNMTRAMSLNLKANQLDVTALALAPGWMRTEAVYKHYGLETGDPDFMRIEELHPTESVEYIGRAVVALASDPQVHLKAGLLHEVGSLAAEYGFTDIDGRRMPPFRV
ncbi:SDR family NAD(P)-dependent oxidoreductase [Paenibacillus chondroitinus]|uniref:SDR family NAD(P)-dependent oxidoreductase n=1 Tax=Paenibacillus chondroitinus TaxID=59842 RepID=A0ABU6DQM8_9BACL|nr:MULTISPECIES: SDR family NAD(P)-dependent oxidoreductase [Paenibacillus]MCY9657255.1 SDR family NAD(P)-dependent oxidoreductase [Paenibacillus anseongense]MEB4799116.1 SDR family NAD(P)-dependent oxidoreductase [Paenibacillus chondroitinus]